MGTFFDSWALWEKLSFVFAIAIVVTIAIGCCKLAFDHWRLRRYAAVADKERRELTLARQMSQRRSRASKEGDQVPFGIRALESGIEVEGVWISRGNTPEPGSRAMSGASSILDAVSRRESETNALLHSRDETLSVESSLYRPASAESSVLENPIENVVARPPRTRHPPLSLAKYGGYTGAAVDGSGVSSQGTVSDSHSRRSDSSHTRDASDTSGEGRRLSDSSGDSSNGHHSTYLTRPPLLSTNSLSAFRRLHSSSTDLELMQSHRLSQAAETGQLTPRRRQHTHEESARITDLAHDIQRALAVMDAEAEFESLKQERAASEFKDTQHKDGQFTQPHGLDGQSGSNAVLLPSGNHSSFDAEVAFELDDLPTTTSAEGPSFQQEQSNTFARLRAGQSSSSASVLETSRFAPDLDTNLERSRASTGNADPNITHRPTVQEQHSSSGSIFEPRRSLTVVRGQGSGFEILAPGSLPPPNVSRLSDGTSRSTFSPRRRSSASHPPLSFPLGRRRQSAAAIDLEANGTSSRPLEERRRRSSSSGTSASDGRRRLAKKQRASGSVSSNESKRDDTRHARQSDSGD